MNRVRGLGRCWWDLVVGNDWRIAAGAIVVLAAAGLVARSHNHRLVGRTSRRGAGARHKPRSRDTHSPELARRARCRRRGLGQYAGA